MLWFPRSMLGRTALVVFVAVALGQIVTVTLLHYFVNVPRVNLGVGQFVTHLKTIRAALDSMHESEHSTFIRILNDRDGIRILRVRPDNGAEAAPDRPPFRFFRERIREVLGPEAEVYLRPQNPRVIFVKLRAGDAEYWIAFPRARLERDPAATLVMAALLGAVIALAAAIFVVWRLNRPLRSLAGAAQSLAAGRPTAAVTEEGPSEIRAVTREFNRMNEAIAAADRERATFLAGVSHDLRTPLARVRLGLEMSGAEAASRDAMVADIDEANRVIEQFIRFARDESDEPLTAVDLVALVEGLIARDRQCGRQATLTVRDAAKVTGRAMALQRLLANLADNAYKYSRDQRVDWTIHVEADTVCIEVADRGPGIPPAEVARLKRPFARLDHSRGGPMGAGLGLAIAERIAKMHGGALALLPRPEGGLIARVTIAKVSPAQSPA
jgi:two-component system, OmpR family, osmolarity sensor histidine kinase EnvZ